MHCHRWLGLRKGAKEGSGENEVVALDAQRAEEVLRARQETLWVREAAQHVWGVAGARRDEEIPG